MLVEEERDSPGGPSDPNCCMKDSLEQMGVKAESGQVPHSHCYNGPLVCRES